jgi:DNA adenine methylase
MRTPFPFAGSKWSQGHELWRRFGDPDHFIDPFCGSCSVLLTRPWPSIQGKSELINDRWGFITNFWRAVKDRPELVAKHCLDMPNEIDVYARHAWLLAQEGKLEESLRADPHHYDAKIAGWFCWGASLWLLHGWCMGYNHDPQSRVVESDATRHKGIFRKKLHLHRGRGIQRQQLTEVARSRTEDLLAYFKELGQRMERVDVLCGDWSRCVTESLLKRRGSTAILLDPPYSTKVRKSGLYRHDGGPDLSRRVREWAILHGENPRLRLAFCGLADEHPMPTAWGVLPWSNAGGAKGRRNMERIWFSPHCLP